MFPLGRCRETRYPSNETGLVLLPGPILFIFYFSYFISSLCRDADNLVFLLWPVEWAVDFLQKSNGLEWTAVCRQGARVRFLLFREIVNQGPTVLSR